MSTASAPSPGSIQISWPLHRPTQRTPWHPESHANGHAYSAAPVPAYPPSPARAINSTDLSARNPLPGIALRAVLLGVIFGTTTIISALLLLRGNPIWRASFFLTTLSLFHFLEYYITATYNPPAATAEAFLLSQNGFWYNAAHSSAFMECIIWHTFWPNFHLISQRFHYPLLALGLSLVVAGQATRTAAMMQAGENFNHTVQHAKKNGHELVTNGVYAYLRHPSYFGFFWWGLGTQLVLGNRICLAAYAVVLWMFFRSRIT
ncbi:hypothetical protein MMC13_001876, partial [Lambiella insularis]|nr:hypothetical protein [Lambiella insularis]